MTIHSYIAVCRFLYVAFVCIFSNTNLTLYIMEKTSFQTLYVSVRNFLHFGKFNVKKKT